MAAELDLGNMAKYSQKDNPDWCEEVGWLPYLQGQTLPRPQTVYLGHESSQDWPFHLYKPRLLQVGFPGKQPQKRLMCRKPLGEPCDQHLWKGNERGRTDQRKKLRFMRSQREPHMNSWEVLKTILELSQVGIRAQSFASAPSPHSAHIQP